MTAMAPSPVIGAIDHLLTHVRDGDSAAATFRKLGFTLSPVSHIEAMGITNRMILFADAAPGCANFIELMSVADRSRLPPAMASLLSGEERIKSMVLATPDAGRCHAHLTGLGMPFGPPIHVRREWVLEDGASVHPEFDVLLPQDIGLTFNACRYHNVDLYRRREWTRHPNTVTALDAVICAAPDARALAARFAEVLACAAQPSEDGFTLRSGGVAMEILTPAVAAARFGLPAAAINRSRYLGYRLRAFDPDRVAAFAREAGVAAKEAHGRIVLPPDAMFGNIVEVASR
jgi:Glyoxalase-like domain